MSKIIVTNGKLLKESAIIKYIQYDDNDEVSVIVNESKATPANSLIKAMQALAVHAAILSEMYVPENTSDITKLNGQVADIHVTGFSIKGGELMKGVVLSAQKNLTNGKRLGFNTPLLMFDDQSEEAYPYSTELYSAVTKLQTEFKSFLGGKHGNPAQQKMDFKADTADLKAKTGKQPAQATNGQETGSELPVQALTAQPELTEKPAKIKKAKAQPKSSRSNKENIV